MKWISLLFLAAVGCTGAIRGGPGTGGGDDGVGDDDGNTGNGGDPDLGPVDTSFQVTLVAQTGVAGEQRVNFALPLPPGLVSAAADVRVGVAGAQVPTARRALASWPDGSLRAVQLQVDVDVSAVTALDIEVGTAGDSSLTLVDVATTLVTPDGLAGPRVWAMLPAAWLSTSGVVGPILAHDLYAGTALDGWAAICDYAAFGIDVFLAEQADRGAWLYDRPTALYRGYAADGTMAPLASAYREAAIYRAGITGVDGATRIGVPTAADDVKYHYSQGLAIHYLLTGDDRFREAAENVAIRMHDLWPDPGYDGGADFWTERNAGFSLLAYEWAAAVSDDRAATFAGYSDEAVTAYLAMQTDAAHAWESDARCFAHSADAHDEPYGYFGCSPWMGAILADGLDAYARRVGGNQAIAARAAIVKLGRIIARHGLDGEGKPFYWMGAGVDQGEVDSYEEHWGESAYIVAMAWHYDGRTDNELHTAALALVNGLASRGEAGQLRSFNWQCRSGPLTPSFLRD